MAARTFDAILLKRLEFMAWPSRKRVTVEPGAKVTVYAPEGAVVQLFYGKYAADIGPAEVDAWVEEVN